MGDARIRSSARARAVNGLITHASFDNPLVRMKVELRCWLVLSLLLGCILLPLATVSEPDEWLDNDRQGEDQTNELDRLELAKTPSRASGRAACPSVQNDGGSPGDAGGTNSTAKSLGSDPSFTGNTGCVDSNDFYDYYSFSMSTSGNDVEFELTVPAPVSTNDFDIYLEDANGNMLDFSAGVGALEQVSTAGSSASGIAGTYYFIVEQYSGDGTYSFDAWTNASVPRPDLSASNVVSNLTAFEVGDTVNLSYTVINNGPADMNDTYDIFFFLEDPDDMWNYYLIEDSQGNEFSDEGSALAANQSQQMYTEVTISDNVLNGTYLWVVALDGYDNLTESDENNNYEYSTANVTVGTVLSCSDVSADAGTGTDAGNESATALDLGTQYSGTVTGCFEDPDQLDFYAVNIADGQELSAILPGQSGLDYDLVLIDSSDEEVSISVGWGESDENVSTIGTNWSELAGTYYIVVERYSGDGVYTLHIWTNGTAIPPAFDCAPVDDFGEGADAGSSAMTAMPLGVNPIKSGMGCLDEMDQIDAYSFELADMHGANIMLDQSPEQDFALQISDSQGNQLENISSPGQPLNFDTNAINPGDLAGNYLLTVHANGGEGTYNLTLTSIDPPLPDITATQVNCPEVLPGDSTDVWTGSEFSFSIAADSVGGPSTTPFNWVFMLVAENSSEVIELLNGTHDGILVGFDGEIISATGAMTLGHEVPSGNYSCRLTIDLTDALTEQDEMNNVLNGANFSIINLDEYWADDVDRDGFPNDEDDCPESGGDSTQDLVGCQDLDGDGWSNQGDDFFTDPTQWLDTDGDLFGDNASGTQGDQCPEEAGVADGTNGTGCPIWIPDSDDDGVPDADDACPGTTAGVVVNETGCEPQPEPEVPNPDDTTSSDSDENESDSFLGLGGENGMILAAIGGGLLLLLIVTMLVVVLRRGKNNSSAQMHEQAWATSISPEQQQYEQQLIAMGYTAEQARAYASQHFE